MKKYLQIILMFSVLLVLVFLRNLKMDDEEGIKVQAIPTSPTQVPSITLTQTPTPTNSIKDTPLSSSPTPTLTSTPTPTSTGMYKNGTYSGSVEDAFYGNVQVQVVISGGKISNVTFLQYPNDNHTSIRINSQAMPLLIQEAIQAQSANVSGVSGASATSPAFQASLSNALAQAKN